MRHTLRRSEPRGLLTYLPLYHLQPSAHLLHGSKGLTHITLFYTLRRRDIRATLLLAILYCTPNPLKQKNSIFQTFNPRKFSDKHKYLCEIKLSQQFEDYDPLERDIASFVKRYPNICKSCCNPFQCRCRQQVATYQTKRRYHTGGL